ncbi:MAG: pyridoxamine 5'-phosphate oxidase family protein [Candidatus Bathyarchaeia archaeon]|jgi:nitroimidazol reductase NimA-like FMN-containing flavoprotein (pyridoxamine 5'-phosphate oxidase superfamily)
MSSNKMTPEDIETLFRDSYTTTFCSHNKDGTIHAAPIWYNYRDNAFYFVSIKKSLRVENLKRNSDVSLSFLMQGSKLSEGDVPSKCALVYGMAELGFEPEEGYDEYVRWVWGKYHKEPSFDPKYDPETQVTLRVAPRKIVHFYP